VFATPRVAYPCWLWSDELLNWNHGTFPFAAIAMFLGLATASPVVVAEANTIAAPPALDTWSIVLFPTSAQTTTVPSDAMSLIWLVSAAPTNVMGPHVELPHVPPRQL